MVMIDLSRRCINEKAFGIFSTAMQQHLKHAEDRSNKTALFCYYVARLHETYGQLAHLYAPLNNLSKCLSGVPMKIAAGGAVLNMVSLLNLMFPHKRHVVTINEDYTLKLYWAENDPRHKFPYQYITDEMLSSVNGEYLDGHTILQELISIINYGTHSVAVVRASQFLLNLDLFMKRHEYDLERCIVQAFDFYVDAKAAEEGFNVLPEPVKE